MFKEYILPMIALIGKWNYRSEKSETICLIDAWQLTVNVVIFAGGKFHENVLPLTFGLFSQYYSYFPHKVIWVLFSRGENLGEENSIAKNTKITPHEKFSRFQYPCKLFC